MGDRCPTDVYYEFHGMKQRNYNPIEIARQYAPKFDKPVVDAVEVVRCKDCKRYTPYRNMQGEEMGEGECEGYDPCVPANHYCSRGERKDDGENDN